MFHNNLERRNIVVDRVENWSVRKRERERERKMDMDCFMSN